jgi:hypothetical protein
MGVRCLRARHRDVDHVAIWRGSTSLRIDLFHHVHDAAALEFRLPVTRDLPLQLNALRNVAALQRTGFFATRLTDVRLPRLVVALRALDALATGAGLRDIASLLQNDRDWPGPGDSTKSRARRLVDLARRLERAGPAGVLARSI